MTTTSTTERPDEDVTVSVIIPYCEKYTPREMLEAAIESAEAQVGVDTEIIVVEDEDEKGPAWARNVGLDRAETRYVAFLDGDDVWYETKLLEQLREMDATGAGLCVDGDTEYDPIEFAGALLTGETFALTSSALVDTARTDVRFDETLERREDHLYLIEVAVDTGVCFVSKTFDAGKYEEGLSKHVDVTEEGIDRFFDRVVERVPEIARFEREYYKNSYVYLGRRRHAAGEYVTAVRHYLTSLTYRPNLLALGALGLTLLWGTYDYLTRPARRMLARGSP